MPACTAAAALAWAGVRRALCFFEALPEPAGAALT